MPQAVPDVAPINPYQMAVAQFDVAAEHLHLSEWIAQQMTAEGYSVSGEQVLITTGSQQAIYLLGRIFLDPGDLALVESPTYLATIPAWNSFEAGIWKRKLRFWAICLPLA